MDSNFLYYGDNLDILRRYVRDESADLIYLDPPFNSNQTYNVLFQEKDASQSASQIKAFGDTWHWFQEKDASQSASQIKAFGDTWHWDETAARSYEAAVEAGGQVAEAMRAFRKLLPGIGMKQRRVRMRRRSRLAARWPRRCEPSGSC